MSKSLVLLSIYFQINGLLIVNIVSKSVSKTDINVQVKFSYPCVTRNESIIDTYFGTNVSDPYRWLENPHSKETLQFIEVQNNLTNSYLEKAPGRDLIEKKLKELAEREDVGVFDFRDGLYYTTRKNGSNEHQAYYVQTGLHGTPKVIFDPNEIPDTNNIFISASSLSISNVFVYALSRKGSDWTEVRFRNITSGEDFPEILLQVLNPEEGLTWDHTGLGLFYSRTPDANKSWDGTETNLYGVSKLYYHQVGTNQSEDTVLIEFPGYLNRSIEVRNSDDEKYMIVTVSEEMGSNMIFLADLASLKESEYRKQPELIPVITDNDGSFEYVFSWEQTILYFLTNRGAPNNRVVGINITSPDEDDWLTLVFENETNILQSVHLVNETQFLALYVHNVNNILQLLNLDDASLVKEFDVGVGTIGQILTSKYDTEFFFTFETFLQPGKIYRVDLIDPNNNTDPTIYWEPKMEGFDATKYNVTQVFYPSKDGSSVPMFIVARKDRPLDGSAPAFLYGYGGYGLLSQQEFSETTIAFLELFDGVYAVANIRGGGEFGTKWSDGGRQLNKQKSYDDFTAAAEYLINNKYTSPSKLTIHGASNGGLLIGVTVNQRPDLFGAAVAHAGVMDMIRYNKFTGSLDWLSEYGTPDKESDFKNLLEISPLHNIKLPINETVQYPAVLVTTGDHDNRVVPLHSYKYVAELQYTIGGSSRQRNPLMLLVRKMTGHYGGLTISRKISESTDMFSFLVQSLGLVISS